MKDDLSRRRIQELGDEEHPSAVLCGEPEVVRSLMEEPDLGLREWTYQPERCRTGRDMLPAERLEAYTEIWVTVTGDPDRLEETVATAGLRLRWESGPGEGRSVQG